MSIDYGMGIINIDKETGIRYGVISQYSIGDAIDDIEPDWGEASCPRCGVEAIPLEDFKGNNDTEYGHGWYDWACPTCNYVFDSDEAFPAEPIGWRYVEDGYHLESCLDFDFIVLKSPYYTHAAFCSPCVPGAGDLDSPDASGVETYCLGHDWFEDKKAPYPVFDVATRKLVNP